MAVAKYYRCEDLSEDDPYFGAWITHKKNGKLLWGALIAIRAEV